jgi:hypothetical protein
VVVPSSTCAGQGGSAQASATCSGVVCRGACCVPPNITYGGNTVGTKCIQTTQAACTGQWHGYGTACAVPASSTNYTTCCPANVNGVNGVDILDIFLFLNRWFNGCIGQPGPPCNGASADWNGNNVIDLFDIFGFLNAWFTGCS